MPRQSNYIIGPESISDYLHDVERRWGVRLAFDITMPPRRDKKGDLCLELYIPNRLHRQEVPWVHSVTRTWTLANTYGLLFLMWDMLDKVDHNLQRGPKFEPPTD